MTLTLRVAMDESSQVSEARRIARKCALDLGLDANQAEQVALVVTEASTNILKHAGRGEVLITRSLSGSGDSIPGMEILALDRGQGIANLEQCMRDGYSTAGSPGQGLGAISRMSTGSDFYSISGKGTAVLARWTVGKNSSPLRELDFEVGAVNVPKPGQDVCGDSWGAVYRDGHSTFLLADGLGHGLDASIASRAAVRVLYEQPDLDPKSMLKLVHGALRSTRGAAVAIARVEAAVGKVLFAGAGNVSAQVYAGARLEQHLISINGTAGHQMQQVRQFSYPWPKNGMLILYSDGLASATNLEAHPAIALRDPTLIAGLLYRDFSRGNDDATVLVARGAHFGRTDHP
jgi:anti-sigma regulatory factor (Ser/Thr protein kinase)